MQADLWEIRDAREDVGEPSLRINLVEASSHDQRDDNGGALGAAIGACEQPSASS